MAQAKIELKPRILVKGERAIGPGKADLLELIEETGSISAAAKRMKMSYSRAWQLVDVMNHAFKKPLVATATGGAKGGGAHITEEGRAVLALYRRLQDTLASNTAAFEEAFAKLLK
jgi:molybdate transport system regulatory protein